MKKFVLGFTLASFALSTAATAGTMQYPIVESDVIAPQGDKFFRTRHRPRIGACDCPLCRFEGLRRNQIC